MNDLYNKIIGLCNEKNIKGAKLCTDVGISKSTLTELKMGRASGLSAVTAQKIASYFGVTVGYLLGEPEPNFSISYIQAANKITELVQNQDFLEFYETYNKLSKKNKQVVKRLVEDLI